MGKKTKASSHNKTKQNTDTQLVWLSKYRAEETYSKCLFIQSLKISKTQSLKD